VTQMGLAYRQSQQSRAGEDSAAWPMDIQKSQSSADLPPNCENRLVIYQDGLSQRVEHILSISPRLIDRWMRP
jgi:hypothetical protein